MTRGRNEGFTLLELLVVLAIMGLMLTISIPFTTGTIERAQLRADARALVSDLRSLRARAIERRETIAVTALSENEWRFMPGRAAHRAVFVTSAGARALIFYPDGTSSGGTFRLGEGGRSVEVSVAWLSGAVAVGTLK